MKKIALLLILCWATHAKAVQTHFAIYDPAEGKDGVWTPETTALVNAIKKMNWTVQLVGDEELQSAKYNFKALIQPGGYATIRTKRIGDKGFKNIKKFVESGGGYVGFCAGAYMATNSWDWAEEFTRQSGTYGESSDYVQTEQREIAPLFTGWAVGPFGWHAWNNGTTPASLEVTDINKNSSMLKSSNMPTQMKLFYYGGPFFEFEETPDNLKVWARAVATEFTPKYAKEAHSKPTIVSFTLGQGDVVLSAYHPVFTIKDKQRVPSEPGSNEWKLLKAILARGLGK